MSVSCVIAVDPGLVTGFCRWWPHGGFEGSWQLEAPAFTDWADRAIEGAAPGLVVVCEDFRAVGRGAGSGSWSIEQIGVLRHLCRKHGQTLAALQTAGDAKAFVSSSRLKELGWWRTNHPHANDSARHLLLWLATVGWYDGSQIKVV